MIDQVKERFLDGETIRAIADDLGLEPPQTLGAVQRIGKEFDAERALRVDQYLMLILRYAYFHLGVAFDIVANKKDAPNVGLADAEFKRSREAFALFDAVSRNNADYKKMKRQLRVMGQEAIAPAEAGKARKRAAKKEEPSEGSLEELM